MVLSDSVKLSVKLFNEPLTWLRAAGCSEWATTLNQMSNMMVKGYWIVSVDIRNPESHKMYIAETRSAFRK